LYRLLNLQASEALGRLKKRFGKLDMFVVIRDSYAFHHPTTDEMEEAFQRANKSEYSEDADWAVYFNKALLNTFFLSLISCSSTAWRTPSGKTT